jgi:diaminopropionate ammonia-lyase
MRTNVSRRPESIVLQNPARKSKLPAVPSRDAIHGFHRSFPEYAPTPLLNLEQLARDLKLGHLLAKVESSRLGLSSFKILGASWAASCMIHRRLTGIASGYTSLDACSRAVASQRVTPTLVAATDGNYGQALAHMAGRIGTRARIYAPSWIRPSKAAAVREEGAELVLLGKSYDQVVDAAVASIIGPNDLLVSDTARRADEEAPRLVSAGYSTILSEVVSSHAVLDAVFVQVGVCGLASAVIQFLCGVSPRTKVICVEPLSAACALESVRAGCAVSVADDSPGAMDGLCCGSVCAESWPWIRDGVDCLLAIPDGAAECAASALREQGVLTDATGAAGLGGLMSLMESARFAHVRSRLNVGADSNVLVLVTGRS